MASPTKCRATTCYNGAHFHDHNGSRVDYPAGTVFVGVAASDTPIATATANFYATGKTVSCVRTDETGSVHDEWIADTRSPEHAQRFVQAVNSFEAMRKIVCNMLADCNTCYDNGDSGRIDCDRAYHMQARAVLAEGKEG